MKRLYIILAVLVLALLSAASCERAPRYERPDPQQNEKPNPIGGDTSDEPGEDTPADPGEENPDDRDDPGQETSSHSRVFYVSASTGDDSREASDAKSSDTPWKTIQHGIDSIHPGDTLQILPGTYNEEIVINSSLSGVSAGSPTLIAGDPDGASVIDLDKDGQTKWWASGVKLTGVSHVILRGISVKNAPWYGISVNDDCSDVTIENCHTFNTRASGIYVAHCKDIKVLSNKVQKACQHHQRDSYGNGTQECITIAGVDGFVARGNEVWGSDVDGACGGEGIDTKGGSSNGEVCYNYIHDILPLGIYNDAGSKTSTNIRVHHNRLENTTGMAVAGELGGTAREIYYYDNIVINSISTAFQFMNIQNGCFKNIYIVNNTFVNCYTKRGNFGGFIGNYSKNEDNSNLVIMNNIFYDGLGTTKFSIYADYLAPHRISHNLYCPFLPGYAGGDNVFNSSCLTEDDVVDQDPEFVSPGTGDYHLAQSSPAMGKGAPVYIGEELLFTDNFDGDARNTASWGMGAY